MLMDERDWHCVQGEINMDISIEEKADPKDECTKDDRVKVICQELLEMIPSFIKVSIFKQEFCSATFLM